MTDGQKPRILRRIVFAYTVDFFPGMLILGHNQLKRMLARNGFDVKVSMAPLNDLPPDVDMVFVPPELAEAARQAVPHGRVEVLESPLNHPRYDALIRQLGEGIEWTAARVVEQASTEESGQMVRYRGYERIE
jgi:mannitol-specific phosphotransferase system IIBC component